MTIMKYGKKDCDNEISAEENKRQLLYMLDELTRFCDQNNIRYYLSGGTLLGAIRHKGFIPWDDDVDINIPRPDLERLYLISGGKIGNLDLVRPNDQKYGRTCQFYKIYNPQFIIEDTRGGALKSEFMYYPLNIDIFPIDGFPENEKEFQAYCKRLIFLRKMVGIATYNKVIGKTKWTCFLHSLAFIPVKIIGYKKWSEWYQKYAQKYNFDESHFVGVTTVVHYIFGERVVKEDYIQSIDVEFCKKRYHAPNNYDTYLKQLYGDYMKLPPKEKQVSLHKIKVYTLRGRK